jgi:peptidoglycan/LPS O-acetylase OafA/YrhL
MSITYRREIDGLRAIAIAAVVLYHAGSGGAGFVGVDVFFVISGYLITALLLREQDSSGRLDLPAFYARRVRRILPAAILVILAVLVAAGLLLPVQNSSQVFQSAAAAALFVANLFFQSLTSGYFSADTGQLPLLHLWSLSVEEQFYLLWPALLLALPRPRLLPALVMLGLASLGLSEWWLQGQPQAAFYQMPARFWELAVGGMIATQPARPLPRHAASAGIGLILAACLFPLTHFPGIGALPAVAGAALAIAALHGGASHRLLASAPMVGLGLISYSLYLWHWPLLAFDRLLRIGPAPLSARVGLVAVSVLLAIASYRYVETPLRRLRLPSGRTLAAGCALVLALAFSAWAWRPPEPIRINANVAMRCHPYLSGQAVQMQSPTCLGAEQKVVIWGDSYAHSWTPMAQELAAQLHMPATTLALDGCPPIAGAELALRSPMEATQCRKWNAAAIAYLRKNGADTVVLAARWQMFITGDPGNGAADALVRTVARVSPHVRRILVVGPTPTLPEDPSKCAALGADCSVSRQEFVAAAVPAWQAIRRLEQDPKVTVSDPGDWLCGRTQCPSIRDGLVLYSDRIHVSQEASRVYSAGYARGWH